MKDILVDSRCKQMVDANRQEVTMNRVANRRAGSK